jgi:hypothetical protein
MQKFILAKKLFERVRKAEDYLSSMPPKFSSFIEEDEYVTELLTINDYLLQAYFGDSFEGLLWVFYSWRPGETAIDSDVPLNTIDDAIAHVLGTKKLVVVYQTIGVLEQFVANGVDAGKNFGRSCDLKDLIAHLSDKNVHVINDVGVAKEADIGADDVFNINCGNILHAAKCESGFFEKANGRMYFIPKEREGK